MTPPIEHVDDAMYREIHSDIREIHRKLDGHLQDELVQYAQVQKQLSDLRADVATLAANRVVHQDMTDIRREISTLKAKMATIAGISAVIATGAAQAIMGFFFR